MKGAGRPLLEEISFRTKYQILADAIPYKRFMTKKDTAKNLGTIGALEKSWETYTQSWKVTEEDGKMALLLDSTEPSCVYADPLTKTTNYGELLGYMKSFHEQAPGFYFKTYQFQEHHGSCVAKWQMLNADGAVMGDGVSFGEFSASGKLQKITGFFEVNPPA